MPLGASQAPEDPAAAARRRLTYLMLFRVGVVSLLLIAALISELGTPADQPTSPQVTTLLGLIAATYGLTIFFALALKRAQQVSRWAALQVAADLLLTTALVRFTGGADSGFVFMYLLVVIGASFVLGGRGALAASGAAVALYLGASLPAELPMRNLVRVLTVNAVAVAATGALGARLAVELTRAREHIASQGVRLRDLAALHEDVIRCLTSGLITVAADGTVMTYNAAAAEILGRDAAAAIGRPIVELVPDIRGIMESVVMSGVIRRGEVSHLHPTLGERVLGVSLSPLVDADGAPLGRIVNFQDVTQLRDMEQTVARSERLAAIGRLAAGIAHEIRNPLAAISGSIELLAQPAAAGGAAAGGAEQGELTAIVLREVERLNALITELLEFARPRAPVLQALELQGAMQELLRVVENDRRLDGARVELRAGAPVWVEADAAQLRQVVWNLLLNAAEASPRGTPIAIEIRADDGWAQLTVRDRGPGIPEEHRARIFEPFFSTKERGTGLGLATVHRIVEEHGGKIEIEGSPEGGAAVTIRLPTTTAATS